MDQRSVLFVILTVLLLLSTGMVVLPVQGNVFHGLHEDGGVADWTVLYYVCGDDPGIDPYVDPLLENLLRFGSSDSFHLLALVDRLGENNSVLSYVTKDHTIEVLNEELDFPIEVDMSAAETLESFYVRCTSVFPSRHVALITYADGGTGWQKYVLNDEDGTGFLSIPSFADCLQNITSDGTEKIDVLQTSCCMSNIELAYEFAPFVDYLLSTQEHISLEYWVPRFYQYVWDLHNQSSMTPEECGQSAADRLQPFVFQMHESYGVDLFELTKILDQLSYPKLHTVMMKSSVCFVNLSVIPELVDQLDHLSKMLTLYLSDNDELIYSSMKHAREHTREYGKANPTLLVTPDLYYRLPIELFSYHCRIDLVDFIRQFKDILTSYQEYSDLESACTKVLTLVDQSIVAMNKVKDDPSFGMNIYFPKHVIQYNKDIKNGVKNYPIEFPYETLLFTKETSWDEFLLTYLSM